MEYVYAAMLLHKAGQKVDATGTSIGKGYAGVVKRYNFRTQDATHGNSLAHRAPGSTGSPHRERDSALLPAEIERARQLAFPLARTSARETGHCCQCEYCRRSIGALLQKLSSIVVHLASL